MLGMQVQPAQLFCEFRLDDHVPSDHLLRRIDCFLDLGSVRSATAWAPARSGGCARRSISTYRWFCRLGLDGKVPDHSTFSRNRHGRFRQSDILRHLFETVVERCLREGLVGGEGFAVDASLIAADANKQRSVPGEVVAS